MTSKPIFLSLMLCGTLFAASPWLFTPAAAQDESQPQTQPENQPETNQPETGAPAAAAPDAAATTAASAASAAAAPDGTAATEPVPSDDETPAKTDGEDDLLTEKPDEPVEMLNKKVVRIRILDKITANTRNFNLDVGQTVSYGDLRINPKACRKAPPTAEPEAAAFLEVWQVLPKSKGTEWVFSGWMFASSPGLSAMDHPIYDVWVIDCRDSKKDTEAAAAPKPDQPEKPVEDGEPSEAYPDLGD